MKKTTIITCLFIIGLLFPVILFSGCDKEEFETIELCQFTDLESFQNTAIPVNKYLFSLSDNLSDEQKLQRFTDWLNSKDCISEAKLEAYWTDKDCAIMCPPGRYGTIGISFNENGIKRELTLNIFGEYSKPLQAISYHFKVPGQVRVSFKSETTTIRDVFTFINQFDFKVVNIYRLGASYLSTLPASSLNDILKVLNSKPYFSYVHGYFNQYIAVDVTMSKMDNKDYQSDWLKIMSDYEIYEENPHLAWFMIDFEVPDGEEKLWMEKFNLYESVIGTSYVENLMSMLE